MHANNGGGATVDDVLHVLGLCIIEQARTQARTDTRRSIAEQNLAETALRWQEMARRNPKVAMYREQQAVARQVRGEIRVMMKNDDGAAWFRKAEDIEHPSNPYRH